MEKLLEFPLSIGLLITVLSVSLACIIIVLLTKKLIKNRTTKQHERVGRLLFRVVAGLIALLVSLSYANEKVRQRKIIDSIEMEASIIINISMRLEHFDADQARDASNKLVDYVELTIKDHWKNVEDNPFFSRVTQSLIEANYLALTNPGS